jgi:hypothetical protein
MVRHNDTAHNSFPIRPCPTRIVIVAGTSPLDPGHPPPMLSLGVVTLDQRQVCLRAGTLGELRQAKHGAQPCGPVNGLPMPLFQGPASAGKGRLVKIGGRMALSFRQQSIDQMCATSSVLASQTPFHTSHRSYYQIRLSNLS